MEGSGIFPADDCTEIASDVIAFAQARFDDPSLEDTLHDQLGPGPFELVCMFVSPEADFQALVDATSCRFGGADVLACTTAGEVGRAGYEEDQVVAIAFRSQHCRVLTYAIDDLSRIDEQSVADRLIEGRLSLAQMRPDVGVGLRLPDDRRVEPARRTVDGFSVCRSWIDTAFWRIVRRRNELLSNVARP